MTAGRHDGVLVFDGDCGFCTRSAGWARRRAPEHVLVIASQDADLPALGLTRAQCDEALHFVDAHGRQQSGAAAVAALLRTCPSPWPVAGRAMALPGISSLASLAYRTVARHRHRLPGGTPTCRPSSDSTLDDTRG